MAVQDSEIREAVEHFLSENYPQCKEGDFFKFVLNPDYRDTMEKPALVGILKEVDPLFALTEYLEDAYDEALWHLQDSVAKEAIATICPEDDDDSSQMVRETIRELCIFEADVDHFLQMTFPVNIYLDTGDSSYDFTLNNHYPHWSAVQGEKLDEKSSLLWLARQQGYSKEQLEMALDLGDMSDPHGFLESVRVEEANANSQILAIGFLVTMSIEQMIDVRSRLSEHEAIIKAGNAFCDNSFILIDKSTTCGLIDVWDGGGSVLGIELEQDVKIPLTIIRSAMPDGGDGISNLNWYGLCESVCKPVKAISMEDIEQLYETGEAHLTSQQVEQAYRLRQREYDIQDAESRIAAMVWALLEDEEEEDLPVLGTEEFEEGARLFLSEYGVPLQTLLEAVEVIAVRFRDDHDWTISDCDQMDTAIRSVLSELKDSM